MTSPDVLREAIFDKLLVLVLVETHEDGVIAGLWSSFEVENHFSLLDSSSYRNQTRDAI